MAYNAKSSNVLTGGRPMPENSPRIPPTNRFRESWSPNRQLPFRQQTASLQGVTSIFCQVPRPPKSPASLSFNSRRKISRTVRVISSKSLHFIHDQIHKRNIGRTAMQRARIPARQATSYKLPATGCRLPATGNKPPPSARILGKMHRMMGQNCSPNGADFAKNAFKLSLLTTLGPKNIKPFRLNGLPENTIFWRGD
jgi:hypothetical protein